MIVAIMVLLSLACIVSCHFIAKKHGANPVFWGVIGAIVGPLAVPFALMAKPKRKPS